MTSTDSTAESSTVLGQLKSHAYISIDKHGHITLTETGLALAKKIYERHTVLTELLVRLGVDRATATEDACKMEHAISDASFEAIQKHLQKYS